ncbi:hypothetical protein Patl1_04398 [Pistacia atlantica]|uniref:Uncharacterized protein n=1 Tax=Pistacia atlantica TaxID=434234 RepID=A0ACC1BW89_9ROSI|nr:hypothetical protein Patl1_04398 [Pistacia atlantica]
MAAMAALQSSMTSLSISSNSFFGQRLYFPSLSPITVKPTDKPCLIVAKVGIMCPLSSLSVVFSFLMDWKKNEAREEEMKQEVAVNCDTTMEWNWNCSHFITNQAVVELKHWERKDCKPNSLPVLHKMHVKLGDMVKVIAGNDKGKIGEITKIEAPIHSSNVMLYSKEQEVASRVGHKVLDDGTRVRYLIKTGEIIDSTENWKKLKEAKSKEKTEVAAAS